MRFCYYGHVFHKRSQSTAFILDIIRSIGECDVYLTNPDDEMASCDELTKFNFSVKYDCYVFFQAEHIAERLLHIVTGRFVIIPMYDGARLRQAGYWQKFVRAQFISFSRTHHEYLRSLQCRSSYFAYFPRPEPVRDLTFNSPTAFFWERRPDKSIDQHAVIKICHRLGVKQLHIHTAADFQRHDRTLSRIDSLSSVGISISRSNWFEGRQNYLDLSRQHVFFFAPRPEEGIGMAFLEAMSFGQVVVAPDRPTMNEYIRHGTTGILYDSNRLDAIARPDASDLQAMSHAAIRRMEIGYTDWCKDVERLKSILLNDGRRWSTDDISSHFRNAVRGAASQRAFEDSEDNKSGVESEY